MNDPIMGSAFAPKAGSGASIVALATPRTLPAAMAHDPRAAKTPLSGP